MMSERDYQDRLTDANRRREKFNFLFAFTRANKEVRSYFVCCRNTAAFLNIFIFRLLKHILKLQSFIEVEFKPALEFTFCKFLVISKHYNQSGKYSQSAFLLQQRKIMQALNLLISVAIIFCFPVQRACRKSHFWGSIRGSLPC